MHVVVRADGDGVPDVDLDQVPVVLAVHGEAVDVGVFSARGDEHQPAERVQKTTSSAGTIQKRRDNFLRCGH